MLSTEISHDECASGSFCRSVRFSHFHCRLGWCTGKQYCQYTVCQYTVLAGPSQYQYTEKKNLDFLAFFCG